MDTPNAVLERVCRLAGASKEACIAIRGLHCTTCRKAASAKLPRPGRLRDNIGQFNDVVLCDLCYVKDANGTSHCFMVLVGEGTYYVRVCHIQAHGWEALYRAEEAHWIDWGRAAGRLLWQTEKEVLLR